MGITLTEVKEFGLLDDEVIDSLPDGGHCKCGAEVEFSESLNMYCPDRYCYMKIAARLKKMAEAMQAVGWGDANCQTVCRTFKFKTPLNIFKLGEANYSCPEIAAFNKKVENICDPEKRKFQLWEVVKILNIPNIGDIAMKLFDGYNSIEEAYEDFDKFQVPLIAEKLGISSGSDSSVLAWNVYNTLLDYRNELSLAQKYFTIIRPEGTKLKLVITGGVEGFRNKSEFIQFIFNRYYGKYIPVKLGSVSSETDILVCEDSSSSSRKHTRAEELGIPIMTSKELIAYLDSKEAK